MDFVHELREALRVAREQVKPAADRTKVGLTLTEAAALSGIDRATIHSIENVKREPELKVRVKTVEQLARAYGVALSTLVAKAEGSRPAAAPELADDESLPPLASEERIEAAAIRLLVERIDTLERRVDRLKTHSRVSRANDRHVAAARAQAAESSTTRGSGRPRDAKRTKRHAKTK